MPKISFVNKQTDSKGMNSYEVRLDGVLLGIAFRHAADSWGNAMLNGSYPSRTALAQAMVQRHADKNKSAAHEAAVHHPPLPALDLVRPPVDVAVRLLREAEYVKLSVVERKVDPGKSPLVAQAYQRFVGACEVLSAMWLQLGVEKMTPEMARRAVEKQAAADDSKKSKSDHARTLLAAVREHAVNNYDQGGWDIVVEAYEDEELAELIARAPDQTVAGAIQYVGDTVGLVREVEAEHRRIPGWHY